MTAQNKNAALDGTNIQSGRQKSENERTRFSASDYIKMEG